MAGKKHQADEEYTRALYDDLLHLADGVEYGSRVVVKCSDTRGRLYIIAQLLELREGRVGNVLHQFTTEYPNAYAQTLAVSIWNATVQLGKMALEASEASKRRE